MVFALVKDSVIAPISEEGDAKIEDPLFIDDNLTEECPGAIILVRRNGTEADSANMRWLAISGFIPPSPPDRQRRQGKKSRYRDRYFAVQVESREPGLVSKLYRIRLPLVS
jgi:hypothetical protein